MKILSVMNNHIEEAEKKDYGYGCTCDNCGTTFIFRVQKPHIQGTLILNRMNVMCLAQIANILLL